MPNPQAILPTVIEAAFSAGRMVADEFSLPGGPRLIDHVTAPVDHEIEMFLRERLMTLVPARFVGEEAGIVAAEANGLCWVVDPHDGTRAFLEGKRGSAVSIALLRQGRPVLAVVFAPLCPDRGPDMIAWAEGGPITRNGAVVAIDLRARALAAQDVIFLNHGVWQRPVWNSIACAPARFMPLPSIAYRLARIAVGDGIATQTLRPVNALDIAAGHALLMAAGGVLVAEDGQPVTYTELGESRPSACFGGAPDVVETLRTRAWRGSTEPRREPRITLNWPRAREDVSFDRAVGCLLGHAIGGALAVDRPTANRPPNHGSDPGANSPRAGSIGQANAATEQALALARTLVGRNTHDPRAVTAAYGAWIASGPVGLDDATARAFTAAVGGGGSAADPESQDTGSLARITPIGLWVGDPARAAAVARAESALSHPHPVCQAACAALAAAIAAGIGGADRAGMVATALETARSQPGGPPVVQALEQARANQRPQDNHTPPVLRALHLAFHHLAADTDAETALIDATGAGATTANITGALLGAAQGRLAFPTRWVMPILTGRPDAGLAVPHPRPDIYWTDDLVDLAEALLTSPKGAQRTSR